MIGNRGIAFKLALYILTSTAVIFIAIFGYNYWYSRRIIVSKIEANAHELALVTVNRIETVLRSVEQVPKNIAYALEATTFSEEGLLDMLRAIVENNPEIYGAAIAYEPYGFRRNLRWFSPYYYKSGGVTKYEDLGKADYRYPQWDWYRVPKELDQPVWTEPYYDKGGGNVIMSTYSVPFYRTVDGARRFTGIVTSDIYLSWLQESVASIRVGETGYAFLISRNGTIVTHPRRELIMKETIFSLAAARPNAALRQAAAEMVKGGSGFVPVSCPRTGVPCWMVYEPIPSTGWSLAVLYPKKELMADVTRLNSTVLGLGFAGIGILLAVIVFISGTITRPLRQLAAATREISRGDLDAGLPSVRSRDEVGRLTESFASMKRDLARHIAELKETTAAKERIESELKIAHDIQMGIVPKIFPPFPEREEFSLHAVLEPAREVGGDFYDFFLIDDRRLCFVIGDVSGKGVPASLFMAVTITLVKTIAREVATPEEIMARVNKEISQENDSCMFVTIFCGVLDMETGRVCYANAGHNSPLIVKGEGEAEFLEGARSPLVGVLEDAVYKKGEFTLRPGEALYMYTDGVTEAINKKGELFSEARLMREVSQHAKENVVEMVSSTLHGIKYYARGMPQSDDITIMVLRYMPGTGKEGQA